MTKEIFFDRKHYLDILEKHITDLKEGYRQNIAFIGDELVGKTSIIFKFLNEFYDPYTIILYLEIRPESLDSFAKRFIATLLYNFLEPSNIALKEDINFLIEKSRAYMPKTINSIRSILAASGKKKNNIFTELLSLCEMIKEETNKHCVLILDEFQNLENMGAKNLFAEWSKLLPLQKNTLFIIVSSKRFRAKTILSKNLSLLFGNFEIIEVEPFDIKTSEQYLQDKLKKINLDAHSRNFIVYFSGGYPYYLEVISDSLLKLNAPDLTDTFENLLFNPGGILNQKFSNFIKQFLDNPDREAYMLILYWISCGHNKIKDIAHLLRKPKKEFELKINRLLESDMITRSADFLKINDRVFGFWLRFVYREKQYALTFDANKQKLLFRQNIDNIFEDFLINTKKSISERMSELLYLFENEIIQIERKKLRLNHFREIKPLVFKSSGLKDGLIGRSSESLWILAFKNDSLTEDDITEFAKECKKYRHKMQKKIIVTLQDIDANARLKALEEKIWTWDLNNINQILDIFSKPRVII